MNGGGTLHGHRLYLHNLTSELLEVLIQKIQESNAQLTAFDLEWTFIIEPITFVAGGARKVTQPWYITGRDGAKTWKPHTYSYGRTTVQLNCAAYSLACAVLGSKATENQLGKKAVQMMQKYGWGVRVHMNDLAPFVKDHPTYRLTVILPEVKHHHQYTFEGPHFVYDPNSVKNLIYLVYEGSMEHYGLCMNHSPIGIFKYKKNDNDYRFCHACVTAHPLSSSCQCDQQSAKKRKVVKKECKHCGKIKCDTGCSRTCQLCGSGFKKGYDREEGQGHRCILYTKPEPPLQFWKKGDPELEGKLATYKLWAYDLESAVKRVPGEGMDVFLQTDNAQFVTNTLGKLQTVRLENTIHQVNLVVCRNVFDTESERVFDGPTCLQDFINAMLNDNSGKNICVAHNGSGYDSRLVFECVAKTSRAEDIKPLVRGCKFMQLKVNDTKFLDSMLHLPGSLANLAVGFFGAEANIRKGHFPHLFNSEEHYTYEGPLPALHYFDMAFMIRDKKALVAFKVWHAERSLTPWHFKHELVEYCKNDVKVLAALMREYHDICVSKFKMSPWFSTTAPSYVHKVVKSQLSEHLELPDRQHEKELYSETISDLAWKTHWGVLLPNEYWFARRALRGGRTDVRKVYHKVSDEDWARGVRIRYQDIVSMYPYVQVARDYPVGLPEIYVYDDAYYPCFKHRNPYMGNVADLTCDCSIIDKRAKPERLLELFEHVPPSQTTLLADETFFGIVCASMTPPKTLFHPVLVTWDEDAGKCIASLNPIVAGVFTSVEFKKALEMGYTLDKLHRFDKYHKTPGLWNPFIKNLYIEKMANSETPPEQTVQDQLVRDYETDFDMGQTVKDSFNSWGFNPAKRQVFKIMLNSGWGKHCQRPIMGKVAMIGGNDDDALMDLYDNDFSGKTKMDSYNRVSNYTMIRYQDLGATTKPNFHDSYLPAGLFVPAYGRLMLLEQMAQLKERVLYHDTDSIVYLYDPNEYNIPESDVWGKWSVEKFDTQNGGIREFVGLAPKSYGMKAENGVHYIKVKGLSLKLAHEDFLNFDVMKDQVLTYLATSQVSTIQIPQMTFMYKPGSEMATRHYTKAFAFQPELLKGVLHQETGLLYPHGYCYGCIHKCGNQEAHTC